MPHLTRIAALAVVVLASSGCAENRASFFIELIKVENSDCTVESNEEGAYRTAGVLDIAFRSHYTLTPLMKNQLSPREDAEGLVAETNGILVEGANIRIWQGGRPQGAAFYSFYQPAASYVRPGDVTATIFTAVPEQVVAPLLGIHMGRVPGCESYAGDPFAAPIDCIRGYRDLVTVGVRMLGTTNGGVELETPEFYYTVTLCFGCSIYCPPDSWDDEEGAYCTSTEGAEETPCFLGQDDATDCRMCTAFYEDAAFCAGFCGL